MGEFVIASFVGAFLGVLSADFITWWIEKEFLKKPVYVEVIEMYIDEK